jgi:hypothetical protein
MRCCSCVHRSTNLDAVDVIFRAQVGRILLLADCLLCNCAACHLNTDIPPSIPPTFHTSPMATALWRTALLLSAVAVALGQEADEAAPPAAVAEATDANATEPVKCPVGGGGFQEIYAVAMLLSSQDKLPEAEACLSDAITTTVPAYRMLSDIATVNGAPCNYSVS